MSASLEDQLSSLSIGNHTHGTPVIGNRVRKASRHGAKRSRGNKRAGISRPHNSSFASTMSARRSTSAASAATRGSSRPTGSRPSPFHGRRTQAESAARISKSSWDNTPKLEVGRIIDREAERKALKQQAKIKARYSENLARKAAVMARQAERSTGAHFDHGLVSQILEQLRNQQRRETGSVSLLNFNADAMKALEEYAKNPKDQVLHQQAGGSAFDLPASELVDVDSVAYLAPPSTPHPGTPVHNHLENADQNQGYWGFEVEDNIDRSSKKGKGIVRNNFQMLDGADAEMGDA